ncbi:helix-turn-helix domain-containing protein [Shinella yambaruensis]|uniref:helix-turn-helix domain-containing protein n=1 Tax=Shinella yambaruensis TaxID=415996 RepID=UPI001FD184F9|nr:helix-turn-helix transcriptional regulator [Shinella yambaruensis]MCJ8027922.1 helix-turn-helix domain-containing protein [Shinella yambaruensis]MCU7979992.1 helix-turn-helix domain-containing protein [Shinella yambaruensis]
MIDLLVAARKDAGLTQVEIGVRLGQRQTFVSKYELGERRLDAAEFVTVCHAIGIDACDLIKRAKDSL